MVVAVQMFSLVPFRPPRGESKIVGYNALFLGVRLPAWHTSKFLPLPPQERHGPTSRTVLDQVAVEVGTWWESPFISSGPIIIVRV